MHRTEHFLSLCEQVRFSLDERADSTEHPESQVADFVARVRAQGLQVTHTMVPSLAATVDRVGESLDLHHPPEVYVVNDPSTNAFAPTFTDGNRAIIVIHSGLVTTLDANELAFTIGHELGHLGLHHGDRLHMEDARSEFEALQARSRRRYAEVSADRVGLVAAKSVYVAARVMIKLASGLPSQMLGVDVDAFVRQVDRDPNELSREWELEDSHPALPFRLWALLRFAQSATYGGLSGQSGQGVDLALIDQEIADRMAAFGDGRLSDMEAEMYELALVWAGVAMVADDHVIEAQEQEALVRLVGAKRAKKAVQFARTQGKDAVLEKFSAALERANNASLATRRKLEESMKAFAVALDQDLDKTRAGQMAAHTLRLR